MITQYINIRNKWELFICYNTSIDDIDEIVELLKLNNCPTKYINDAIKTLNKKNTGFTYTNESELISIVSINCAKNASQFINTIVHEAKHIQSHICSVYNVNENSEEAAYLIGYIVQQMYKVFSKIIKYV